MKRRSSLSVRRCGAAISPMGRLPLAWLLMAEPRFKGGPDNAASFDRGEARLRVIETNIRACHMRGQTSAPCQTRRVCSRPVSSAPYLLRTPASAGETVPAERLLYLLPHLGVDDGVVFAVVERALVPGEHLRSHSQCIVVRKRGLVRNASRDVHECPTVDDPFKGHPALGCREIPVMCG